MNRVVRRRGVAVGALAIVAVAVGLVVRGLAVDTRGARVVRFIIHSRLVHRDLPVAAVVPAGPSRGRRPLLIFLHGKGEDQDSNLTGAMYAALARQGARAPDVIFPYGGADSYWHDRAGGEWGSFVARELVPTAVRRLHADSRRVAIGGISMGGFGALDIARLHPRRFCAVGGHSAAIWPAGGDTAAGAFDDAQDFARHDVIGAARAGDPYPSTTVWIDVGSADPFRADDTLLVRDLRAHGHAVRFHVWPGGHDQDYWQRHWGSYLGFYSAALARCHRGMSGATARRVRAADRDRLREVTVSRRADRPARRCRSHRPAAGRRCR